MGRDGKRGGRSGGRSFGKRKPEHDGGAGSNKKGKFYAPVCTGSSQVCPHL